MENNELLDASCRLAFSAYLHDLGKFAERARMDISDEKLQIHLQQYARKQEAEGKLWYSHQHAAWTAMMWDTIESQLPELVGDNPLPFKGWGDINVDDSMVNAAARHHKPDTFLQWIVATADRVASGFGREEFKQYNDAKDETKAGKNHFTARQLTLLEQISLTDENKQKRSDLKWRYKLEPLTVQNLFPVKADGYETDDKGKAQDEYKKLWQHFTEILTTIPESHRKNWSLWLDHFDSAWGCFTQSIPSATAFNTKPEVSLYDHSRTTAALATALWRYHHENRHDEEVIRKKLADYERPDWNEEKILLIQGDFYGIQDFIFATGGETQKKAARLLRGRSFYVSLLTECAALKILESLSLPPTSQVINAAGKFLIVAPNTLETKQKLKQVQSEFDQWFLQYTFGKSGIGFATIEASCNDFVSTDKNKENRFKLLIEKLFGQLEAIKKQRFNLCGQQAPAVFNDYLDQFHAEKGACQVDGLSPAKTTEDGMNLSHLARDQIVIGKNLTIYKRILISNESLSEKTLKLPIFGYYVHFTGDESHTGKFAEVVKQTKVKRFWDISLPKSETEPLFKGYAKRFINAYVPQLGEQPNAWELKKYPEVLADWGHPDEPKTLEHIACEDRWPDENGRKYYSPVALVTLKGDVDDLGRIFQAGLAKPTFTKMASLSRQLNAFFAIWLPWYCSQHPKYKNIYTVFAGGDDFFLIGPWESTLKLAQDMQIKFAEFVAHNEEIHFSAGLIMTKPGIPVRQMGQLAEESLEQAKSYPAQKVDKLKNAVTCFGHTVSWKQFNHLMEIVRELEAKRHELKLSTSYLYGLIYLSQMAQELSDSTENKTELNVETALWNSRFSYRTWRMLKDKKGVSDDTRRQYQEELGQLLANNISKYGEAFQIALFTHLYHYR
jgi:CRISPR-associated protein Csm1